MESIKRRIKLFWLDHRDPILFYSMVIIGIILIVQLLNNIAIQKEEENNSIIAEKQEVNNINTKEDNDLIESFINYCKENKIAEAYDLISKKCKEQLYPTVRDFEINYYNKRFNKKRTIEFIYEKEKDMYKVIFYPDILETGKYTNEGNISDYYLIEQEVIDRKIYINH